MGRNVVTVRLSDEGLAAVDALAQAEERDRSSMVRILLREALAARGHKSADAVAAATSALERRLVEPQPFFRQHKPMTGITPEPVPDELDTA